MLQVHFLTQTLISQLNLVQYKHVVTECYNFTCQNWRTDIFEGVFVQLISQEAT